MLSKPEKIKIKLYGLGHEKSGQVRADVFADKISSLVRGLRAADKLLHGYKSMEYLISDLKYGSAEAALVEYEYNVKNPAQQSAVSCYRRVTESLLGGARIKNAGELAVVRTIVEIASGVDKKFSHGELQYEEDNVIRIDGYLRKKAFDCIRESEKEELDYPRYQGAAFGTFKGVLKAIDLRGQVASAYLILSAGGIELDCVCSAIPAEDLGAALDKRVVVRGKAIYNGFDGLPERLDIRKIDILKTDADLAKWAGTFRFDPNTEEDTW